MSPRSNPPGEGIPWLAAALAGAVGFVTEARPFRADREAAAPDLGPR